MRYVLRRLPQLVAALFAVTLLTFLSLNLLGDPLKSILGPQYADREVREETRKELNLDDPVPERYVKWLGDAVQGDFGRSYNTGERVSAILSERIPISAFLMVYAQILALVLAVPIAIVSAYRADRLFDRARDHDRVIRLHLDPQLRAGVLLLYALAVTNDVFPARYLDDSFLDQLYSLFLPALTLALPISAAYMRILRADLIRNLEEDFITLARIKGISTTRILLRHALRPSSVSLLTVIGLQVGTLLGGTLVVENIFSIPGLGKSVVDSVFRKDYLVVQTIVLIIATTYVVVNFVVDAMYAVLDPRVRSARTR